LIFHTALLPEYLPLFSTTTTLKVFSLPLTNVNVFNPMSGLLSCSIIFIVDLSVLELILIDLPLINFLLLTLIEYALFGDYFFTGSECVRLVTFCALLRVIAPEFIHFAPDLAM
jgi:hypothetical protein